MKTVQQDMMCVLLRMLLDKGLISRDIHDKAWERILEMKNLPEFFSCPEEVSHGGS